MSDWQPMDSAPHDGSEFQARIPGNREDNVIAWVDVCGGTYTWTFTREQEPPDCWTDGYFWGVNEDGQASVKPTHWKPLTPEMEA